MVLPWIVAGVTIWWAHRRAARAQETADAAVHMIGVQAKNDLTWMRQACWAAGIDPDEVAREGAEFVGPDGLINEDKLVIEMAKEKARQAVRDVQAQAV